MKILALPLLLIATPAMSYSCYNYALDEVAVIEDQTIVENLKFLTLGLQNPNVTQGVITDEDGIFFMTLVNQTPVLMAYSNNMGLSVCGEDREIQLLSNILKPTL